MGWLLAAKWTTREPEGSEVHKSTNSSLPNFTAILILPIARKTSRTTQFLQELPSWTSSMKCCISSYRRRLSRTTIGKNSASFSRVLIPLARESTKLCNSWGAIKLNSMLMILTAFTVRMLIWLCWGWLFLLKTPALFERSISMHPKRCKSWRIVSRRKSTSSSYTSRFSRSALTCSMSHLEPKCRFNTISTKSQGTLFSCFSLLVMTSCQGSLPTISDKSRLRNLLKGSKIIWLVVKLTSLMGMNSIWLNSWGYWEKLANFSHHFSLISNYNSKGSWINNNKTSKMNYKSCSWQR